MIRIEPLIFVGSPGCGKSMFCRELRQILKQDNDIFLSMGNGGGISMLFGSTPEYKEATNGQILSSIWQTLNNEMNLINPIIVLDEIEKACLSSKTNDVNQNVYPSLIQLLCEENIQHFKDNFFQISIKNFYPNFLATANSIDNLPSPLFKRIRIIKFRDYTEDEFKKIVIPHQFESFRRNHNDLVPEKLTDNEIDLIYKLSKGNTRQVQTAINRYISVLFDIERNRQSLDSFTLENLLKSTEEILTAKQIGFARNI